jgi:hypothetical protein
MAIRIPKLQPNWDKVDPIHIGDAIALWCNINPKDLKAREATAYKIEKTLDLFCDGKEQGILNFPSPLDERRAGDLGTFYGKSDYYLSRKTLKAFAKEVGQKPLFLFHQKSLEKRYNIPPKPYKHKFNSPSWEYIKRADTLPLASVFEMFFGKGTVLNVDLEHFSLVDNPPQPESDIFNLFAMGIIQGYYGNFIKQYGEYRKGGFGNLAKGFTPLYACPLPTYKVFLFIQEKDITGLLEYYGYEIQAGLSGLVEYFSLNEESEVQLGKSEVQKSLLPAPKGSTWGDVRITLIANDSVEITISGHTERCSYHELGMSDKRSGDKPRMMWWLLVRILKEGGFIPRASKNYNPKLPDTIKGFKAHMKNLFKIQSDVIGHYKKENGYRAQFIASDRTQVTFEELLRLPDAD